MADTPSQSLCNRNHANKLRDRLACMGATSHGPTARGHRPETPKELVVDENGVAARRLTTRTTCSSKQTGWAARTDDAPRTGARREPLRHGRCRCAVRRRPGARLLRAPVAADGARAAPRSRGSANADVVSGWSRWSMPNDPRVLAESAQLVGSREPIHRPDRRIVSRRTRYRAVAALAVVGCKPA